MTKIFDFAGLPLVVQRQICSLLSILDLIKFALVSPKFHEIAKKCGSVETLHWVISNEEWSITLSEHGKGFLEIGGEIHVGCCHDDCDEDEYTGVIGGVEVSVVEALCDTNPTLQFNEGEKRLGEPVTKFLFDLFNIKTFILNLDIDDACKDHYIFKYTQTFESANFSHYEYSWDDMSFLLNSIKCGDLDIQETHTTRTYVASEPLKTPHLDIPGIRFADIDVFLNSTFQTIDLQNTCLNDRDLITIVRYWKAGGLENMKMLKMSTVGGIPDLAAILNGVYHERYRRSTRPKSDQRMERMKQHLRRGYNVWTNDGKRCATLAVHHDRLVQKFFMIVWELV